MRLTRFLISQTLKDTLQIDQEFYLPKDQAHHAKQVLKLKLGQEILLLAGTQQAHATIISFDEQNVKAKLLENWSEPIEECGPSLAVCLIKNSRFEWLIEKAVELGAKHLYPIISERSQIQTENISNNKISRWQKIAEESRKQCGSLLPLKISTPIKLTDFIVNANFNYKFFLSIENQNNQPKISITDNPLIVIGPEGGFSSNEINFFHKYKFIPWNLHKNVLRTETAALAALSILNNI